jgi:hypothetical protein
MCELKKPRGVGRAAFLLRVRSENRHRPCLFACYRKQQGGDCRVEQAHHGQVIAEGSE